MLMYGEVERPLYCSQPAVTVVGPHCSEARFTSCSPQGSLCNKMPIWCFRLKIRIPVHVPSDELCVSVTLIVFIDICWDPFPIDLFRVDLLFGGFLKFQINPRAFSSSVTTVWQLRINNFSSSSSNNSSDSSSSSSRNSSKLVECLVYSYVSICSRARP